MLEAGGLSLSAMGGVHSPVSCSLDADDSTEPYTTERLSQVPGGYVALTEPFQALDIDFNSVQVAGRSHGNGSHHGGLRSLVFRLYRLKGITN